LRQLHGLHCFSDPAAAISEIARVLRPAGVLRGSMVVRRAGLRQDAFVRLYQLAGMFGPGGTARELASWIADAGMLDVSVWTAGALAYFSARRNPEHA
jgi:SAM-dependent methyltransferase